MSYLYWVSTERKFAQEIRVFGAQEYLIQKYRKIWDSYFSNKRALSKKRAVLNALLSVFPEMLVATALFITGSRVLAGASTIGEFTLYNGLLVQLIGNLRDMVVSAMGLVEKKLQIEHVAEFERLVDEESGKGEKPLGKKVDIEFRHVSFKYPGTDKYVIRDISFCLPAGKKVCIVGENGAGKSTLFKLLLRFYEPCDGQILLNGIPAEESEKRAERMSGVSAMLHLMPSGRETFLTRAYSDDGVELSGGQNQKIALARMFYRDASVLILDEPSADLDPRAEYELFQSIRRRCARQSLIYVSHRLANVDLADEIIVMQKGRVRGK